MTAQRKKRVINAVFKIVPLILSLVLIILFLLFVRDLTIDEVINYTPKNKALAASLILLAFALKSFTQICPQIPIFLVCSRLFPAPVAMAINTVGLFICYTLPYLYGRLIGPDIDGKLKDKTKVYNLVERASKMNPFMFGFMTRIVFFVPGDIVSLIGGSPRYKYVPYVLGSVIATLPNMIPVTLLGVYATEPGSKGFILSVALFLISTLLSFVIYYAFAKHDKKKTYFFEKK